jgi:hypothetical protein
MSGKRMDIIKEEPEEIIFVYKWVYSSSNGQILIYPRLWVYL